MRMIALVLVSQLINSNLAFSQTKSASSTKGSDGKTYFDFEETMLEGKMKVPTGMILRGRIQQDKAQMVNLRKDFRPELKKSRAAVRSIRP